MQNSTAGVLSVCLTCSSEFRSTRPSKYCGRKCRDAARVLGSKDTCASCGSGMFPHAGFVQGRSTCRKCRALVHGTSTQYKRGCRCPQCLEAKAKEMRDFNDSKRLESGVNYSTIWRRRFREENGHWPNRRGSDWIDPKARLEIYERDGWICYLCESPVDREGGPNGPLAPSLDHVFPRSLGGGDTPSNLKTACRACNSRKGIKVLTA